MRISLIIAGLVAVSVAAPRVAMADVGDAAAGEHIFKSICSACHSNKKDTIKIGPPLYGAYGRKAASFPGFNYSSALKSSGLTWDTATLQKWEAGAKDMVPGTKMTFPGLKSEKQRNDIIAYLQTLHD